MGYVLRELSFQHVLFLLCLLQFPVYLDDFLGYLSQLIIRKAHQVVGIKALTVVGTAGKDTQLANVLAQPVSKSVEHQGEDDNGHEGEPDVMLVGRERLGEVVVIR